MRHVADLADAGRAHRMALGLQAAAGVHRPLARQAGAAFQRVRSALAFLDESQILGRDDLGDGEAIVHFGELDVAARVTPAIL